MSDRDENGTTGGAGKPINGRTSQVTSPRIEGEGFVLRPWRMEDCPSLAHHANNERVSCALRDHFPYPYTLRDAEAFIAMTTAQPAVVSFAVEVDGRAVGGVGFVPGTDIERLSAEVGYWLGEEFWGRGIMSAAVRALGAYVFANTEIIRLWAGVFATNPASGRVLEKAGFTHLTTLHRAAVKRGEILDIEYYELLKPCI